MSKDSPTASVRSLRGGSGPVGSASGAAPNAKVAGVASPPVASAPSDDLDATLQLDVLNGELLADKPKQDR
jgi:hypothetical protein